MIKKLKELPGGFKSAPGHKQKPAGTRANTAFSVKKDYGTTTIASKIVEPAIAVQKKAETDRLRPAPDASLLFPHINAIEDTKFFEKFRDALASVLPMKAAHRRDLPLAVINLSTLLTEERSGLARPYWAAPRFTAAYLHYFLPWNIIRLRSLFAGLKLSAPRPVGTEPPTLLDLGSGPLAVPLALWLAYPTWRDVPLNFICLDVSPQPLELGRAIFYALAGKDSPWRIITRKAALGALKRGSRPGHEAKGHSRRDTPDDSGQPKFEREASSGYQYIFSANVLNEWLSARRGGNDAGEGGTFVERLGTLLGDIQPLLAKGGTALFVEPGTRLGGKTVVALREAALNAEFENNDDELDDGYEFDYGESPTKPSGVEPAATLAPLAPCPHSAMCPMAHSKSWCHFTFRPRFTPAWLEQLSDSSGLAKTALSLSFMLLRKGEANIDGGAMRKSEAATNAAGTTPKSAVAQGRDMARIISAPFAVPGLAGQARYACTARGLALIEDAENLPSGALLRVEFPAVPLRDKKSGAIILNITAWKSR